MTLELSPFIALAAWLVAISVLALLDRRAR
jgi:hypothetical protein